MNQHGYLNSTWRTTQDCGLVIFIAVLQYGFAEKNEKELMYKTGFKKGDSTSDR